jgi:hypothetical protein
LPIGFLPRPAQQDSPDTQCLSDKQNSPVQFKAHVPLEQQDSPDAQWEEYLHDFPIQDLAHLPIGL